MNRGKRHGIVILVVLLMTFSVGSVCASDLDLGIGGQGSGGTGFVGLGVGFAPDYEGSDEYEPVPLLRFRYQWDNGMNVSLFGNTLRADLVGDNMWSAGPIIRYRAGREDVESNQVAALKDVDAAIELGAFAGLDIDNWILTISGLQDVSDAHDGFVFEFKTGYKYSFSREVKSLFWAGASYASDDYMETYFSIDASNRGTSTLPSFRAGDGLKDVELGVAVMYNLSPEWELFFMGRYRSLLDDASDSPVTDLVGDSNQFLGGFGASYRF